MEEKRRHPRRRRNRAKTSSPGMSSTSPRSIWLMRRSNPMPRKHRHNVYVIELDPAILNIARFRNANPERDLLKPCVYVGMTGLTPEARFAKHKAGIRANRYVQRFGLRLLPELYAYANPMPYQAARDMEVELAIALREQGYAVWQA